METETDKLPHDDECVVHDHPVPAELGATALSATLRLRKTLRITSMNVPYSAYFAAKEAEGGRMETETDKLPHDDECVVHDHPVPADEVGRYSVERDPAAEEDIANYIHGQARDETVQHVERVKTEYIIGEPHEIWDVTTDKNRWWVITNRSPTCIFRSTFLASTTRFPSMWA